MHRAGWSHFTHQADAVCMLFMVQVFIIAFQDEDLNLSFKELVHTRRGVTTVTSLIVSLCGMAPFIYIEVGTPSFVRDAWWFPLLWHCKAVSRLHAMSHMFRCEGSSSFLFFCKFSGFGCGSAPRSLHRVLSVRSVCCVSCRFARWHSMGRAGGCPRGTSSTSAPISSRS